MAAADTHQKTARLEQELRIQRQIAFASGLFQGDVTVRTLLESLAEGVVIIDRSGTILLVNAAAEKMFGYSKEDIIGKPHAVLIPERCRKVHEEHEAHFFAEPRIRPMGQLLDLAGRRRDGSEFPVEISLGFIETINGVLVLALVSDMTLRKQFEEKLRESEELFHVQMECVKDHAVFTLDTQGKVLNWNAGAERLKGYPAEEIIGRHFSCFYPEEERNAGKPDEVLRKAAAEGRAEDEGWRVRKDGSRFWADVIMTAIRDEVGNLRGFSKVARDITERKKAQEALRFSEARYRALYHDNPTMIATLDAGLTMLSVNPICGCLLGYTTDELEGRSVLEIFHEDDRQAVAEQLQKCLQHPGQVYRWQFRKIRKDAEPLWVEETAQAMTDLNGALNILVVCQDITERKRVEEALNREKTFTDTVINSMPGIFYVFDDQAQLIRWNKKLEEISGRSPEGMSALRPHDFVAEENHGLLDSKLREVFVEHRNADVELLLLDREGRKIPFYCTGSPMAAGDRTYLVGLGIDISERKRAEEARRESEQRFASFMLHLPAAAWMKDLQGRYVYANAEAVQIFSAPLSALLDKTDGEVFPPETARQFRENDERVLAEGGSLQTTEVLCQTNGIEHHSIVSKFAVPGPDGQPAYVAGVALDVTERKRAEEERERLLVQLDAVLHSITDGVVISDLAGNILTMNPAALAIHGFDSVEQVRQQLHQYQEIFELFDLDGHPVPFKQWPLARALRGERFTDFEVHFHRKDTGKLRVCSYSGTPVRTKSGDLILTLITLRDVTERQRAEEALRKSELRLSKIFHAVPALIGITTVAEGRCIDINETGLRTLGYRREEVIDHTMLELGVWESKSARDRVIRILQANGAVRDLEINFRAKDGRNLTGLFSADLVDFNGDRYMLSIVNDITERKRMEEEIKSLNAALAERATELEAFNYTVAHDLRKPLTVINGYCQALQDVCGDNLDEACKGYLREAYDGTWRMNRLIDALLEFSRLAYLELRRGTVKLSELAHDVAAELQMGEPGRLVTFRIADGIMAEGDPDLLRVVLANLLGNAWKYSGKRDAGLIEFGTAEVDGTLVHFVRDNGAGFDMADANRLFAPFQRLPGAEECKGFGIGLATVERIIRRHGGRVWAEGAPDRGATFYFTLGGGSTS